MKIGVLEVGNDEKLFLIAGPCVIESEALAMETAQALARIAERCGIGLIYKSSFDKANRTSHRSFRGPGLEAGLRILERVRNDVSVPVITDVHEDTPVVEVASVVDVLQTPAFLCRQTGFIQGVARCGKPVNIKKGQFLAPWDMAHVADKAKATGNRAIMLCERGASFGYNYLVSDMRSLAVMRQTGCPVVFDATHSVQMPGGQGTRSGGQREFVPVLARAAVAAGVAGVFMETHPNPDEALSDGPNAWPLDRMEELLDCLLAIDEAVKSRPRAEEVRGEAGAPQPQGGSGYSVGGTSSRVVEVAGAPQPQGGPGYSVGGTSSRVVEVAGAPQPQGGSGYSVGGTSSRAVEVAGAPEPAPGSEARSACSGPKAVPGADDAPGSKGASDMENVSGPKDVPRAAGAPPEPGQERNV